MLKPLDIEHYIVGVKDHISNGTVQKVIRNIREGIIRVQGMRLEE